MKKKAQTTPKQPKNPKPKDPYKMWLLRCIQGSGLHLGKRADEYLNED